jgi:hypothetical protein
MNIGEYWPSQYIMLHSPKKILANIHAITVYCDFKTNQTEFAAYIILTNSVNATNLIILRFSMALSTV